MPSQKTAEKKVEKKADSIEITAVRTFAVDYTAEELKKMQGLDKEKRSFKGSTRNIEPGKSALVSRDMAKNLTDSGAAKVKL